VTTPTQRIDSLEAEAFRVGRHLETVDGHLAHLTNAAGDLSQGQRQLHQGVRELRDQVTGMDIKLDVIAMQLLAVSRHLGIEDPTAE